jgi:Flp pilus assembly protein TadG
MTTSERPAPITLARRVRRLLSGERGTALIETAMTLPLLLLVSVGIFEFGRAFQTWQVLTNAAREGARLASKAI